MGRPRHPAVGGPALVTGRGRFTADLVAALICVSCAARLPRGASSASALRPGRKSSPLPSLARRGRSGRCYTGSAIGRSSSRFAKHVVRFVGGPIAAVYAPTAAAAEDIADGVEIEIEESPAVIGARDALAPDAPRVHESGNVVVDANIKTAGFDATLGKAHRRIRLKVRSRRQNAIPLETRAAQAASIRRLAVLRSPARRR